MIKIDRREYADIWDAIDYELETDDLFEILEERKLSRKQILKLGYELMFRFEGELEE